MRRQLCLCANILVLICLLAPAGAKKFSEEDKPKWAKKDIRDYSEADLERLLDQWDEDEEPLPEDELPEHLRPPPQMAFDPDNIGDPEGLLKMSKKGRTLMMFVQVKAEYSLEKAQEVSKIWQSALHNNHIQAERYEVGERRTIFMFKDGAMAWDAKDFLIEQQELESCSIDNKVYPGRFTPEGKKEYGASSKKKASKNKKKKKDEL